MPIISICPYKGAGIFFGRGWVPNLQKVGIKKIVTPPPWYTLPPKQGKFVSKSVFLNKINTLSMVILWLTPYFSFQKFMTPRYIWDPPPSEENASPLRCDNIDWCETHKGKVNCPSFHPAIASNMLDFINGLQLAKMKKNRFLICPCHKIYRVEAVSLAIANML